MQSPITGLMVYCTIASLVPVLTNRSLITVPVCDAGMGVMVAVPDTTVAVHVPVAACENESGMLTLVPEHMAVLIITGLVITGGTLVMVTVDEQVAEQGSVVERVRVTVYVPVPA